MATTMTHPTPLDALEVAAGTTATTAEVVVLHDQGEPSTGEKLPAAGPPPSGPIARTRTRKPRHKYSVEVAEEICRRLTEIDSRGWPRSLRSICDDPAMPSRSSVMGWLRQHEKFREIQIEARRRQGEALLDPRQAH